MADNGSRPATPRTPVSHRMVQVNFDPPHILTSVPGIGPKLAKAIVNLRENAGNVYPESLGILMRRPLDEEVMQMLDFRPNPRLLPRRLIPWRKVSQNCNRSCKIGHNPLSKDHFPFMPNTNWLVQTKYQHPALLQAKTFSFIADFVTYPHTPIFIPYPRWT
ncbi:hypothetical protein DPMN_186027 [Dreissena polymorpha]|uniref:Uncharacterized protein n=1 Tax=Dreissena polymorpha TaxID=45954 RepID=A0A9D4DLZ6_DREPO|nr:hypothetical protein DPMN_186027 [Dreissena polymorpha]